MNWLKFDSQKLSKRPDMLCQSSSHARGAVTPLGLDDSQAVWLLFRQRHAQTHVWPCKVVEGLKEHHAPPHVGTIFTEAPAFADQRSEGMTQGEVQTLEQTRADRQTQFLQPLGATAHAVHQLLQTPLALLFDHLAIDQIGMGLLKRLLRA